ncbi:MAG: sigma-70 family RNA polymerase sigma factor [Candidatus Latescibacteria bacterium]|nr:sigma-70 family RNA polymerase sigma factor [Candidatus Latescibacterota bacterium]
MEPLVEELPEPVEVSEDDLVERSRNGDTEAFSELVERHQSRIYQTVYSMVRNRDDAEDLVQEVFLKAYRNLAGFSGGARFYTWLYRLGVNTCLDWRRRCQRRLKLWSDACGEEPVGCGVATMDSSEAPDSRVSRREIREMLDGAMDVLRPEYRAALVLREIHGLSYKEIAYTQGYPVGTAKGRVFRAKSQLREVLEGAYNDWYHHA